MLNHTILELWRMIYQYQTIEYHIINMITQQHTEEDLSRAYVLAVGAKAGYSVEFTNGHDYGVDGSIKQITIINNRIKDSGFSYDFQLKASVHWTETESTINYKLDIDTYNYLCDRAKNNSNPIILIFLALPKLQSEWLNVSDEMLIMKKACYWKKVEGVQSENTSSKTITFQKEQLFDVENLQKLFDNITQGVCNE